MPISDAVIDRLKKPYLLISAEMLAKEANKKAYREWSPAGIKYALVNLSNGGFAVAEISKLSNPDLRREAPQELTGRVVEMSFFVSVPVVEKSQPTRQATDLLDENPQRPVLITQEGRPAALIVGNWDRFESEEDFFKTGPEWYAEVSASLTAAKAWQYAQSQNLAKDRPIIFRRPDGSFGHLFLQNMNKWAQLIQSVSDMPVGKVPLGPSVVVDRFSHGEEAKVKAAEPEARGVVLVLEDDQVVGVVFHPGMLRKGAGSDFFAVSTLSELYGASPGQSADPRADIAAGRPPACPHCQARAKLVYNLERDQFTCAQCGQATG